MGWQEFYETFGGNVFLCHQAVDKLHEQFELGQEVEFLRFPLLVINLSFPSHFQLLEASLTSAEECREGVSPFLRASRGGFQSSALLLWHSPLRLVYALRWSYSRDRQHMAEKFLLYTHTHTRCHMRCFKDIATAGVG